MPSRVPCSTAPISRSPLDQDELRGSATGESSQTIRERVLRAREIQQRRYEGSPVFVNAAMNARQTRTHCRLESPAEDMLKVALTRLGLSARSHTACSTGSESSRRCGFLPR